MKKLICILLAGLLTVVSLSCCSFNNASDEEHTSESIELDDKDNRSEKAPDQEKDDRSEKAPDQEKDDRSEKAPKSDKDGKSTKESGSKDTAPSNDNSKKRTINGSLKDFDAQTLDGDVFTPYDFSGFDITVINFWGTYCGPCIAEMPDLAKFAEDLPSNINFVTFCIDAVDNEESALEIINDAGLGATVITSADGDFNDILEQIMYIPTTLFIDKNGNIVGVEIIGGVPDLEKTYNEHIESALAEIKR